MVFFPSALKPRYYVECANVYLEKSSLILGYPQLRSEHDSSESMMEVQDAVPPCITSRHIYLYYLLHALHLATYTYTTYYMHYISPHTTYTTYYMHYISPHTYTTYYMHYISPHTYTTYYMHDISPHILILLTTCITSRHILLIQLTICITSRHISRSLISALSRGGHDLNMARQTVLLTTDY